MTLTREQLEAQGASLLANLERTQKAADRASIEHDRLCDSIRILEDAIEAQDRVDARAGRSPVLIDADTGEPAEWQPARLPPILDFGGRPESPELQALRKQVKRLRRVRAVALGRVRKLNRICTLIEDQIRIVEIELRILDDAGEILRNFVRGIADAAWLALLQAIYQTGRYHCHSDAAIRRRIQRCARELGRDPNLTDAQWIQVKTYVEVR